MIGRVPDHLREGRAPLSRGTRLRPSHSSCTATAPMPRVRMSFRTNGGYMDAGIDRQTHSEAPGPATGADSGASSLLVSPNTGATTASRKTDRQACGSHSDSA